MSESQAVESVFASIVAKTGQPPKVQSRITEKLDTLYSLVIRHNSRVLRIQQTKQADPNNVEMLDSSWANAVNAKTAPAEILEAEAEYQSLIAESEKLLTKLREFAKTRIEPPLSAEEVEKEKKAAAEEAKLIDDSKESAKAFAEIVDEYLEMLDEPIDGGIMSMIPDVESLRNTRGRRASAGSSSEGKYRTRFDSVLIDGTKVSRIVKKHGADVEESNLVIAAETLNKEWNASALPQNEVTDEQLERAMYDSQNKPFRNTDGMEVEFDFDFTKEIAIQQPNDDSVKMVPMTKRFHIVRNVRAKATDTTTDEKATDEKPVVTDEKSSESAPVAEQVAEVKPEVKSESKTDNAEGAKLGPAATALKAKQEAMKAAQAARQGTK